jgi:predicted NAD-dependent protein-ADP-ribosyltransferase YbiA (DUF1768 family)
MTHINFYSGKKEYRSLSNFWEQDVSINDDDSIRVYESGEHCFHGEKYTRLGLISLNESRRIELMEYGKTFLKPSLYKTGAAAKKAGGKKGLLLSHEELETWSFISIDVQSEICKWKFDNYEEVRLDLLKSGDKTLIHPALRCNEELVKYRLWEGKMVSRHDGSSEVIGENRLGKLWMDLRSQNFRG